jgi:hypothetical protein
MQQPKFVTPEENKIEPVQENKERRKIRQKDCYLLGRESILRARKESFPYWKNMFYIKRLDKDGPEIFPEFLRHVFEHEDYIQEFSKQSDKDAEAAKLIINDLVVQTIEEFERWKKENQGKL